MMILFLGKTGKNGTLYQKLSPETNHAKKTLNGRRHRDIDHGSPEYANFHSYRSPTSIDLHIREFLTLYPTTTNTIRTNFVGQNQTRPKPRPKRIPARARDTDQRVIFKIRSFMDADPLAQERSLSPNMHFLAAATTTAR